MEQADIQRFAQLALDSIGREYPYHLSRVVLSPGSIDAPRAMTPVFYGCFDWHSAVHGHWLLALAMRLMPGTEFAEQCRTALHSSLDPKAILIECEHLKQRPGFERPYGLAWLLALAAELECHQDDDARAWRTSLGPLESIARDHLASWLPKLAHPIRCGTHAQTAFAMCLIWDWSQVVGDADMASLLRSLAIDFYGDDHGYPLHLEPSGEDFLSASLGAASLMTRVYTPSELTTWLDQTMPQLARGVDLKPVTSTDPSDGRLAHLDGLNLSRAWMLYDIAGSLAADDDRQTWLLKSAKAHADQGLQAVSPGALRRITLAGHVCGLSADQVLSAIV